MSTETEQMRGAELHYEHMMAEIEKFDPCVTFSVVPGSRLHAKIHNPVSEGIDDDWADTCLRIAARQKPGDLHTHSDPGGTINQRKAKSTTGGAL